MSEPSRCYLHDLGIVATVGSDKRSVCDALMRGDSSGMVVESGWHPTKPMRVGRVGANLPNISDSLAGHRSRTNQLLLMAAQQIAPAIEAARRRFGAKRIGIVIGTSTSGIAEGEAAMAVRERDGAFPPSFHYSVQEMGTPAQFLADILKIDGPAYVVSTACTSGAKAMASARRLLWSGLCDAVVTGGADSLCRLTLNGFAALELTTSDLCNPMSANRHGINIGEGAALFLMSLDPAPIALLGAGESSDAHHISAPDPTGLGAETAMRSALADARVEPNQIAYVNLHGTATRHNDSMEAVALSNVLGTTVPCSSTKALTGHTLGAAGAIEAGFCWLSLSSENRAGALPPHVWDGVRDPALPAIALTDSASRLAVNGSRIVASNSFAFGGNNISLVMGAGV